MKLPDKPSKLIRIALADLKKAVKSPRYKINMGTWHDPDSISGKCHVCLAGSVMAFSLKIPIDRCSSPEGRWFDSDATQKLYALDRFRQGEIAEGLDELGLLNEFTEKLSAAIKTPWLNINDIPYHDVTSRKHVPYLVNPQKFHRQMNQLADDFEAMGM